MPATFRWTWPILTPAAMGRAGSARGFTRSLMGVPRRFSPAGRRRVRHVGVRGFEIKPEVPDNPGKPWSSRSDAWERAHFLGIPPKCRRRLIPRGPRRLDERGIGTI